MSGQTERDQTLMNSLSVRLVTVREPVPGSAAPRTDPDGNNALLLRDPNLWKTGVLKCIWVLSDSLIPPSPPHHPGPLFSHTQLFPVESVCSGQRQRGIRFLKRRWGKKGAGLSSVPNLSVAVEDKGTRSAFTVKTLPGLRGALAPIVMDYWARVSVVG